MRLSMHLSAAGDALAIFHPSRFETALVGFGKFQTNHDAGQGLLADQPILVLLALSAVHWHAETNVCLRKARFNRLETSENKTPGLENDGRPPGPSPVDNARSGDGQRLSDRLRGRRTTTALNMQVVRTCGHFLHANLNRYNVLS
jgi:hypothetical protein